MGLAAIFKFIVDGLKMIPSDIAVAFSSFKGALGMEVYPALLGVGYIVGPKTAPICLPVLWSAGWSSSR